MLPNLRFHHALLFAAGLGCAITPVVLSAGCGPSAVGVEACRRIEDARCDAAASCGMAKDQIADCKLFYQDQCLHGIENTAHRPTEAELSACIASVKATAACADGGVKTMSACADAPVLDEAKGVAPCDVLLSAAHQLTACAFADAPDDAGTTTTSSTTTTGGTGGTGGSTGGTGGSTGGTGGSTGATGGVGGTTK